MIYSHKNNVLIKNNLPKAGIVSSNPQRVERIKHNLSEITLHTDTWGVVIYTGYFKDKPIFVSSVPMGAAGSGFAFLEMYAAGAEYIVRYGSNDKLVTEENLSDIIIVDEADNLNGMMQDGGYEQQTFGKKYLASPVLVKSLEEEGKELNLKTQKMICHNTEDYHAFNFPDLFGDKKDQIKKIINKIEGDDKDKRHCWDMETTALFHRAHQFNKHGATVLQSLIKHNIDTQPYESVYKEKLIEMEDKFCNIIFSALTKLI